MQRSGFPHPALLALVHKGDTVGPARPPRNLQTEMEQTELIDEFFCRLAGTDRRALLLDYDGTLAPFRVRREDAVPYDWVRPLLNVLIHECRTRVVVISGRAIKDLLPLLGVDPAPEIWGSHGWEHRRTDGSWEHFPLPSSAQAGLELGRRFAAAALDPDRVELKPGCVAVHWRGLSHQEQTEVSTRLEREWAPIAADAGLEAKRFDGGLELRLPGRHKGLAVDAVLKEMGEGTVAAYLGDDLTDEDAFQAILGRGLGVLVRAEKRPTAAEAWLQTAAELRLFLERWAEVTR